MNDGGYGIVGNFITYFLLNEIDDDNSKKHREILMEEDKEAYEEYLKYEEMINNGKV